MPDTYPRKSEVFPRDTAEFAISTGTYPDLVGHSVDLYRKIINLTEKTVEVVDFGESSIEVGSRDGRYIPVIRALGLKSITAIDPSSSELMASVENGILSENEIYKGTLESWGLDNPEQQVDTAFVFNLPPHIAISPYFINALLCSVQPGGLVVSSFAEWKTYLNFTSRTYWGGHVEALKQKPKDIGYPNEKHEKIENGGPNHYYQIGRRTDIPHEIYI